GLQKEADFSQIKKAYRQKALEFHPDRNQHDPEAEEKFKEASEAYEVLSDPQKRQIYDQWGHQGLQGRGFHGFDRVDDIFTSFSDVFEDFFGSGFGFGSARSGRHRGRGRHGGDLEASIKIKFEEAVFGTKKEVEVYKETPCEACAGKGSKSGKMSACATCGGSGRVAHSQGFFMIQTACPRCHGEGEFMADPCDECRGQGRVRKKKEIAVKVPAGVENGMRLILRGEGNAGVQGGHPGDLYVQVQVEPHPFFKRHGDDIHCSLPVSMVRAAMGIKIKIPTLEGEEEIRIEEGTDSGHEVRLRKRGVANVHTGRRGDQVIKIVVETPKKLSKKQKQILEEFLKSEEK
ncbi:MAG: molecular chaperone DnaJ, partial [bacterium]|nr:molecular chaperone DnaJ [bacterium]